jgi:hypothetical protein
MNNLVVAIARETKLFIGTESAPGVQQSVGNCNLVLAAGAGSVQQNIRKLPDPQYRNTLSMLDPIVGSFDVGKWNFPAVIKTVQASGAPPAPELDPVLSALFGLPSDLTQTAWFGSNTRAYLLKQVQPQGTVYPSVTIYFKVGHTMFSAIGATVNQGEFNVAGNDLCKGAFSGEFMRHCFCGTDAVDTTDTGSGTTLKVQDARKFFIALPGDTFQIQFIDYATGALGATATVTASDGNFGPGTLTLSGTVSRSPGDLIAPYLPAGSEVGIPMYGKYGVLRLGPNISTKVQANLPQTPYIIQSGRVTFTNNIKYHADLKDGQVFPSEYVNPTARTCEGEITVFMYRDLPVFMYKALRDPLYQDYLILPMQDRNADTGRIAEFHCPRVAYDTPNISGEDEKSATIAFKSTASPSYDDEAAFVFAAAPSSATTTSSTTTTSTTTT